MHSLLCVSVMEVVDMVEEMVVIPHNCDGCFLGDMTVFSVSFFYLLNASAMWILSHW